jgi:hypothetical protein
MDASRESPRNKEIAPSKYKSKGETNSVARYVALLQASRVSDWARRGLGGGERPRDDG